MDVTEKLVDDVHSKLMGLLQRAPYIRCEDVNRQYSVNWLMNNGVTVQKHGRWLLDGRCSECLENPLTTHKTYCPSCGAKMDLER